MPYTLVALHAHPDDEASKGACTVAKYSDAGVRCVLVTATGGEAGDILNPAMDTPEVKQRLTEIRDEELRKSAAIIGYHDVVKLGFRDSGMSDTEPNADPEAFVNAPFDDAVEAVVRVIRRERPQVLLGYDEHARYPHPDHLLVHDIGLAAFAAAADPLRFPEAGPPWVVARLYAPMFRRERLVTLHETMLARGLESPFADWLEGRQDHDEPEVAASIEVSATLARGRDALLAHRTQVDPDGFWFAVPEDLVRDVYPYEDFELMAGDEASSRPQSDLFEGIAPS